MGKVEHTMFKRVCAWGWMIAARMGDWNILEMICRDMEQQLRWL